MKSRIFFKLFFMIGFSYFNCKAQSGTMIDSRDGKEYKTIKIGELTWMAENLAYEVPNGNSDCYKDSVDNCKKYGRLYTWKVAMEACPSGWHLPSKIEMQELLNTIGGDSKKVFKELIKGGSSGFDFQMGGIYSYSSSQFTSPSGYRALDNIGAIWTSTEEHNWTGIKAKPTKNQMKSLAYLLDSNRKNIAWIEHRDKNSAVYVRCVNK